MNWFQSTFEVSIINIISRGWNTRGICGIFCLFCSPMFPYWSPGLLINPNASVECIKNIGNSVDLVLCSSVGTNLWDIDKKGTPFLPYMRKANQLFIQLFGSLFPLYILSFVFPMKVNYLTEYFFRLLYIIENLFCYWII